MHRHWFPLFVSTGALACAAHSDPPSAPTREATDPGFRVMTYNIVHGTRAPIPAFLSSNRATCATLGKIGKVIEREQPDVVALQEADGGGRIDRPLSIGRFVGFASVYRDRDGAQMRHGAALLSRAPIDGVKSRPFEIGPFDNHGFVVGTLPAAITHGRAVTIVSVHLNPYSSRARRDQIELLADALKNRTGPMVVMGDFNCASRAPRNCVGLLERRLGLRAIAVAPKTHGFLGIEHTLDWILISDELDFASYRALPDRLSDHRALVADLVWRED